MGYPHNYGLRPSPCKRLPVRGSRACAEAARPREVQMSICLRRREFMAVLGGTVAGWPLTARAQQPGMPVIGFLHVGAPEANAFMVAAFREGLRESGFVEGRNVTI